MNPTPEGEVIKVSPSHFGSRFKLHIYIGWGIRTRHRQYGPLDLEKTLTVIGRALGYKDLHHIYVSKVKE